MNDNAIHYRYFRGRFMAYTNRIVSVGYEIIPTPDNKGVNIIYAVAYCGSKDSFSRKKAREVIKDRINRGLVLTIFNIDTINFPTRTFPDLIKLHYNTHNRKFNPVWLGVKQIPDWAKHID